jgi:phosphoesterase RecJ-like protein
MTMNSLEDVVGACRAARSFLVTSHTGPDGDSVGSILGMKFFLESLGKTEITCALQDPVPRAYDWMPSAIEIVDADNVETAYDLVVVVDVAQRERIGRVGEPLSPNQKFVVIDHHPADTPFSAVSFVDHTYASCAEILLDLHDTAGVQVSREAAIAIYVGLLTDTGSFRFGNTDARAHRNAARLIALGIDPSDIANRVLDAMSMQKLELLRRVLARIERSGCERFAWSHLLERDLQQTDASAEDTDGLVNFIRNLEGIQVAALFRELSPGKVKVSLRSRPPVDAGAMLKPLGGGGHAGAAGLILHAPLDEAIEKITSRMAEALGPAPQLAVKKRKQA